MKKDFDDTKIFSSELTDAFENTEDKDDIGQLIKKFVDGDPKNVNPLTEIPEPKMKLYGFSGAFNSEFFDTEEELNEYVKTCDTEFGNICVIEYLGRVAGRSDVIRVSYKDEKEELYTSVNEDGYAIYNEERSIHRGKYVWEFNNGSIREMYSAFRDRGIAFEDDTYVKIDEKNRKLYEMLASHDRGPILTKKKTEDKK